MCSIFGLKGTFLTREEFLYFFNRTKSRGPDDTRVERVGDVTLGFHRLSIMGLSPEGMQPFSLNESKVICNGELYDFRPLKRELEGKGYEP